MKIQDFENGCHYKMPNWSLERHIIYYDGDNPNVYNELGNAYRFSYRETISDDWIKCSPLKENIKECLKKYFDSLSNYDIEKISNEILELIG